MFLVLLLYGSKQILTPAAPDAVHHEITSLTLYQNSKSELSETINQLK